MEKKCLLTFVAESLFTGAKCSKIFTRFRNHIGSQFDYDATQRLGVGLHIKENTSKRHFA